MMTKTAHAQAAKMIEPIDRRDANNAFELGYVKIANALPLTDEQRRACYDAAVKAIAGK